MSEKPHTFEELQKVDSQTVSDILRSVYQFLKDVYKIKGVSDLGITITYKDIVIFQEETKNGLTVNKETRFRQFQQEKNE